MVLNISISIRFHLYSNRQGRHLATSITENLTFAKPLGLEPRPDLQSTALSIGPLSPWCLRLCGYSSSEWVQLGVKAWITTWNLSKMEVVSALFTDQFYTLVMHLTLRLGSGHHIAGSWTGIYSLLLHYHFTTKNTRIKLMSSSLNN